MLRDASVFSRNTLQIKMCNFSKIHSTGRLVSDFTTILMDFTGALNYDQI